MIVMFLKTYGGYQRGEIAEISVDLARELMQRRIVKRIVIEQAMETH
jgi:hypothetical protein